MILAQHIGMKIVNNLLFAPYLNIIFILKIKDIFQPKKIN